MTESGGDEGEHGDRKPTSTLLLLFLVAFDAFFACRIHHGRDWLG